MDAILALVQVGQNNDWSDRGLPEVVTNFGKAGTAAQAGAEWMVQNHPSLAFGAHWRLLVWALTDRPYNRDEPDEVITPRDLQTGTLKRRSPAPPIRRRARRLTVPHGRVVHKAPAGDGLVGQTILITQDRSNNACAGADGPWYAAAAPGRDAVAARVYQVATLERGDTMLVRLGTKVGQIGWMPLGHGIIPVEEG